MANRETRRKQRNAVNKKRVPQVEEQGVPNIVIVGIVVIILLAVFYGIAMIVSKNPQTNNDTANNSNNDNTPAIIQYDEILAGETFKMDATEYYVLYYDFSDEANSIYGTIISSYKTAHTDTKIYTVDLSKGFNTSYIGDVSNPNAQTIDDLKIKGPSLIKIKSGANVSYTEGKDAIKNTLK